MNLVKLSPKTQIRKLIEDRAAAMRAKHVDRVFATQAESIVQFILAPPLKCAGKTAFTTEALKEWFASFEKPLDYQVTELEIAVGDDVAYAHSLNHLSSESQGGKPVDFWFRETLCFRRSADEWKITHEHSSVPFHMDGSFRAAVDLKP